MVNILALCFERKRQKQVTPGSQNVLTYSTDAGQYVCNNLTYNFQSFIEKEKLPVSYSFIHVPEIYKVAKDGNYCNLDAFEQAIGKTANKSEAFTNLIASEVASFIKKKDQVMNELMPKKEPRELRCEPVLNTNLNDFMNVNDELTKKNYQTVVDASDIKECIENLRQEQNLAEPPNYDNEEISIAGESP